LRRTELLAPMPVTALAGLEFFDGLVMAADCAVAAGDLPAARSLAERLRDLPFYREEGHLATARLLLVTVLAGDWSEALGLAERFLEGWERAAAEWSQRQTFATPPSGSKENDSGGNHA
jgi:hypothetical protein